MAILIILAVGIPLGSAMIDGQKTIVKNYYDGGLHFAIYDKDGNMLRGGAGDGGSVTPPIKCVSTFSRAGTIWECEPVGGS